MSDGCPRCKEHKNNGLKVSVRNSTIGFASVVPHPGAVRWKTTEHGDLLLYGEHDKLVAQYAPGTWQHVEAV